MKVFTKLDPVYDIGTMYAPGVSKERDIIAFGLSRAHFCFRHDLDPAFIMSTTWSNDKISHVAVERHISLPTSIGHDDGFINTSPLVSTFVFRHHAVETWINANKELLEDTWSLNAMSSLVAMIDMDFNDPWKKGAKEDGDDFDSVMRSMFHGDKDGMSIAMSRIVFEDSWFMDPDARAMVIKHLAKTRTKPDEKEDAMFIDAMKRIATTAITTAETKPFINVRSKGIAAIVAKRVVDDVKYNDERLSKNEVKEFWASKNKGARGSFVRAITHEAAHGYIGCDAMQYLRENPIKEDEEYGVAFNAEIKKQFEYRCKKK